MGSMIHSHGVHFFALAAPDLLMGLDADPATRNIVGIVQAMPDVATKALRLRTIGQRVVEEIGGRGTHPVSFVAGGAAVPLSKERRERVQALAQEGVALGKELLEVAKKAITDQMELVESLPLETHYMGTVNGGVLDFYQGDIRLRAPDGKDIDFASADWASYIFEETLPTSYAKYAFCRTSDEEAVPYRVGPLARLNICDSIDTPGAAAELEEFRKLGGAPCHQTVMYHYARLIEILHSLEKLAAVVADDEIASADVKAKLGSPRSAACHVEAPRGTLIHDYEVDSNGIVTKANLIVATQQNLSSMDACIGMAAQQYLEQDDALLLNAIEFSIRCYDPCLSCATHRVGDMKLEVVVRKNGEPYRTARR